MEKTDPGALAGAAGADGASAERQPPSNSTTSAAPQLWPYQIDAVGRIETAPERRVLVVAPTGAGKTVVAAEIIRRAAEQGLRVLFLCHRRELVQQSCRKLFVAGIDAGIVAAGFPPRPGQPVQVGSIPTVHARAIRSATIDLPDADLVIVDEAHHARARTWQAILDAYPSARIIGLTATPCRGDGRGLGNIFGTLIEASTVSELTAGGYLVPAVFYAPMRPDLSGVHVKRGDYVEAELAKVMDTETLVGDVIAHWHKLAERRRTVVFAVDVRHSMHLCDEFNKAGVLAAHIDGTTPVDERDAKLNNLATGILEVVVNCQVLTEGWDCPAVSCIVLARPTKSLGMYRQMVGRVLRMHPGKENALVLDHAGAVFQHGFVDDPIQWTLDEDRHAENKAHDAGGEGGGPRKLTTCPECAAVRLEGQPCPCCGWRPKPKPRHVDIADGVLGRVGSDRSPGIYTGTIEERRLFFSELLWIAEERKYARGWAAHKYRERFGVWPDMHGVKKVLPGDVTRAWVRSRQIAYAKAMQAGAR